MLAALLYAHSSRNMHALGRPELECPLKIYVEIYVKSRVSANIRGSPSSKLHLDSCKVRISDCVG